MRTLGLLFASPEAAEPLVVGGITVIERQARQLRRAGVDGLYAVDVVPLTILPEGVEAVSSAQLASLIDAGDRIVSMSSGLVIDERAIGAMLDVPAPALLVCDADAPGAVCVERIDMATVAAGIVLATGGAVRALAAGLGQWSLESALIRTVAADPGAQRVDFLALPTYAPARRRHLPLMWLRPDSPAEAAVAGRALIAASQKGCLDWPARFLHPVPENLLVGLLAPTRVTPNMVTLATGALGVAAGVAFATGWLWTGLVLALITGPLDGVDGKLARTRCEYSRWGDLEHLLDKLLEYGWYLCAAWYFSQQRGSALPWAIAALIILPAIAEAVQGEFFRRMTGVQLDDVGDTERRIRLVAGRRNTFLWTWLGFAALGLWFEGFVVLAAYSVVTTAVAQWRFYKRLSAYGRESGHKIAINYAATAYSFLPKGTV
jgi:phosphatidylglycerophosphate synthase